MNLIGLEPMKILALEPYYGGSHRAFVDGWAEGSHHDWAILGLPPYKWKWRMRHSAIYFAEEIAKRKPEADLVFCSDMLNLAELIGLLPNAYRDLPKVVYFHENQLTYPVQCEDERDYQFAMTNLTTALAADAVWFNSQFHRDSFLAALAGFLKKMPDFQPIDAVDRVREKSSVHPPGVDPFPSRGERKPGPLRILWSSRWEHDKNPEDFFLALRMLKTRGVEFRISVLGESFRNSPRVFKEARTEFEEEIDHWGYLESREAYRSALLETDVFVSTANHEFFGIGAVEAMLAGNYPLLPDRLAYPELLDLRKGPVVEPFYFTGSPDSLTDRLVTLDVEIRDSVRWNACLEGVREKASRFLWEGLGPEMDRELEKLLGAAK